MKQIDKILRRVSILYYIFLIVTIASFVISFTYGIMAGLDVDKKVRFADTPPYEIIIFVVSQLLICVASVWALVLFVKMLILIWNSLRKKDIFNLRIIRIIRRFIIVYLILTIFSSFGFLSSMFPIEITTAEVLMSICSTISTVIILLMFCEVLKIGNILKAEQDLTV